jgi:calcineurin-like phosphoesterase
MNNKKNTVILSIEDEDGGKGIAIHISKAFFKWGIGFITAFGSGVAAVRHFLM